MTVILFTSLFSVFFGVHYHAQQQSTPMRSASSPIGLLHQTVSSQPLHQPINIPVNTELFQHPPIVNTSLPCTTTTVNLRLLVIATTGTEAELPAITQVLDAMGTPYTVYTATKTPNGLTASSLANGCQGNYQGVILTNGLLTYQNGTSWVSALSQTEWNALWLYELYFGIREVSWYTNPSVPFGFQMPSTTVNTTTTTIQSHVTSQARANFSYLSATSTIPIQNAYTYLAQPTTDGTTTPFIVDTSGNALAAVHTHQNGRQTLAITFDSNSSLLHSILYAYGFINWVTNGLFLGSRHIMMSPQVDDLFIPDDVWPPTTACGTSVSATGVTYRITGADLVAYKLWQNQERTNSTSSTLKTSLAFNGVGTTAAGAGVSPDTLTPQAKTDQAQYNWITHTYDHVNLDAVTATTTTSELTQNDQVAHQLGFTNYNKINMVTPDVSGLANTNFLQAAATFGIRYLVSDTSVTGGNNPSANIGIYNALVPSLLEVPRHPVNLFYNVGTPNQWTAEYNCSYASYWGHNLTYAQLLDEESQTLLVYLLRGDLDPWMFHQTNMQAYDGTHSLLGDLVDATLTKYRQYYTLPILFPTFDKLAQTFAQRMQYSTAGVTASVTGKTITLTAVQAAMVPVTGLKSTGAELYGGQSITTVSLQAGQTVTFTLT